MREVAPHGEYIGLDYAHGPGVDRVITGYKLPVQDETADFVISASCFEHAEFFWETFLECLRICKHDGIVMINAPSNSIYYHQFPIDAWRFMPDAGLSLQRWAEYKGYNPILLESFIGRPMGGSAWIDNVMVFLKNRNYIDRFPRRMIDTVKDFDNARINGQDKVINFNPDA